MPIDIVPPPGSIADTTLEQVIQFVITLLFATGVIFAIAFLIFGGIRWIMSGGNKEKVEAARGHIVASIVGLVIIAAAFLIFAAIFQILGSRNPLTEGLCIPTLQNPFCPPPTPTSPPTTPTATPSAATVSPSAKTTSPTTKAAPLPTCKPGQKPTSKGGFASCK